jgi:hypothetical protein
MRAAAAALAALALAPVLLLLLQRLRKADQAGVLAASVTQCRCFFAAFGLLACASAASIFPRSCRILPEMACTRLRARGPACPTPPHHGVGGGRCG